MHRSIPIAALYAATTLVAASGAQSTFTTQDLSLETRTGTLPGTLLVPAQLAANAPVALIIAGSGPTDRDGNAPGLSPNSYKWLAEGLAAKGIATLRYDKFGSGKSVPKITGEADLRFEDYAIDAAAWLERLKADPRFKSVYVIGHSEGSLVGILAAGRVPVTGFISLAGAGRNIADVLLEQLTPQLPAEMLTESTRVLNELRAGRTVSAASIKLPEQLRAQLFRDSVQPYLISWMRYDPAVELKKLTARVLVVQGSTDLQVSVKDAQALAGAVKAQPVVLEGVNHVLKTAPLERAANVATYTQPNLPIAQSVVDALASFVTAP
jgi:hypothetical protein